MIPDTVAAATPTIFDLVDKGGTTAVLLVFFAWFARWLPRYLEKQGERQEKMLAVFQAEQKAERDSCDKRFNDILELLQTRLGK